MAVDPVTAMAVATFATPAAKRAVDAVVNGIIAAAKHPKLQAWRAQRGRVAAQKIRQLRMVKTIWQIDKAVDLTTFFVPPTIGIGKDVRTVTSLDNLKLTGGVVVEGTIGQGKSTLLRYLTSVEMMNARTIPVFVELRRLEKDKPLLEAIASEIDGMGLPLDVDALKILLELGRVSLFLDAFDEVRSDERAGRLTEIEDILRRYGSVRICITTRAETGLSSSPLLQVFRLNALRRPDVEKIITKVCASSDDAVDIIRGIKKDEKITGLLTTPLMVALLVFHHRANGQVPENRVAFFRDLFHVLLSRHDGLKPSFSRKRHCSLPDTDICRLFDAFCFLSAKDSVGSFGPETINLYFEEAAQHVGIAIIPEMVIKDISEITCALLREGGEYKFLHKVIQEYHSAQFIASRPEEQAAKFYSHAAGDADSWNQQLAFLSVIDYYRFAKFYRIPVLRDFLALPEPTPPVYTVDNKTVENALRAISVEFGPDGERRISYEFGARNSWCHRRLCRRIIEAYLDFTVENKGVAIVPNAAESSNANTRVSIASMKRSGLAGYTVCRARCESELQAFFNELKIDEANVKRTEASRSLFEF